MALQGDEVDEVDQLAQRVRREVDAGLLPSCQYALAIEGEVVAGETLGDATDASRYVIFSATRAVVASTFWTLIQDGAVDIGQPVVECEPDFMADGDPGAGGQLAWADPESGLSFVYLTNGLDAHTFRQARRGVALSSIAADCVA